MIAPDLSDAGLNQTLWAPLRYHDVQHRLWTSQSRFKVVPAGRRSGKTALAKRKLVIAALAGSTFHNPSFFAAAPTYNQAKRIYWNDLKAMVPPWAIDGKPSESDLVIPLVNGARIFVVGMDVPARIEGTPWDGGVLDEYGNMKDTAWPAHVRPALADRNGWCWLIGVPEGRNHYYQINQRAISDASGAWGSFAWKSSDILPPEEIEAAKNDLDELTFSQEYEASFVVFTGSAYYAFRDGQNTGQLEYNPRQPLIICLDFNVSPGVAAIAQEQVLPNCFECTPSGDKRPVVGTGIIGEVWIPRNSNTPAVCRKIIQDWGEHQGDVYVFGDASGGSRGTAQLNGTDWDLVKAEFRQSPFRDRIHYRYQNCNPAERTRVNAVNSRCKSASGVVRFMIDPKRAPHVLTDFEGVRLLEGGSGEIDKTHDPMLTHLSDAIGYYIARTFPVSGGMIASQTDF